MLKLRVYDLDNAVDTMAFYRDLLYYKTKSASYKIEYDTPDGNEPTNPAGVMINVYKYHTHYMCQNIGYWTYEVTLILDKARRMEIER